MKENKRGYAPIKILWMMGDKILNDTVAFVKSIAKMRNRNEEWAEKSVRESASITGEEALKNKESHIKPLNNNLSRK